MSNVSYLPWGKSVEIFHGLVEFSGKQVYSRGVNEINPHELIPLHPHLNDNEDYQAVTEGLKVLVVPASEMEQYSETDIKSAKSLTVGEAITCPKGYAHALYNDSAVKGYFCFCKYR